MDPLDVRPDRFGRRVRPAELGSDPGVELPDLACEPRGVEAPAVDVLVGVEVGVDGAGEGEPAAAVEDPFSGLRTGCSARAEGRNPLARGAEPPPRNLGGRGIAGQEVDIADQHASSRAAVSRSRAAVCAERASAASAPSHSITMEAAIAARRAALTGGISRSRQAA